MITKPATPMDRAVIFERLRVWMETYDLLRLRQAKPEEITARTQAIFGDYTAALGELPPDLLAKAVDRTIATHTNHFAPPFAAEIMEHVAREYHDRRTLKSRAQLVRLP